MKTIEEIKEEIAKEKGHSCLRQFLVAAYCFSKGLTREIIIDDFYTQVAIRYSDQFREVKL